MEKRKARIEQWSVLNMIDPFDPFKVNTEFPHIVMGKVFGHGGFEDGENIATSQLVAIDPATKLAETQNTMYELGKIDPVFKEFLLKFKEVAERCPDKSILENL